MRWAYYNDSDPQVCAWVRVLAKRGLITDGEVDERSIVDVSPEDVRGFSRVHFFCGIATWDYALELAGWGDRPVWTGSCPCQPFSAAGAGDEFADERHLWPALFRLIRECRPLSVFGEQVASKDALAWLDHVCADLEGEGYAVGAVDSCAAGYGAPHIRQRLYWVADDDERRSQVESAARWLHGDGSRRDNADGCGESHFTFIPGGQSLVMGDTECSGREELRRNGVERSQDAPRRRDPGATNGFWSSAVWIPCRDGKARPTGRGISPLVVAHAKGRGQRVERDAAQPGSGRHADGGDELMRELNAYYAAKWATEPRAIALAAIAANGVGYLRDPCPPADEGEAEAIDFDPDNSAEARVMRLRGYGNAIVAEQAVEFIRAYCDIKGANGN